MRAVALAKAGTPDVTLVILSEAKNPAVEVNPFAALRVTNKRLLVCLVVALLLRLAFVLIGFPFLQQRWNLREDGDGYGLIAQTIREGHYNDVIRGPVYPVFVAALGQPWAVKVAQALLDTLTCALIFWLVRFTRSTLPPPLKLRRASHAPVWAAWLWAVYPFAIWRVAFINKEVVLTFLLVSYVCVQVLALRERRFWQWLVAGGLLALVNLCKPMFIAWPLVVLALAFLHRISLWKIAALVAAMIVVIAPWTMRNSMVTNGAFLPVATERGGVTTFIGNYQPTLGLWEGPAKVQWMAAVDAITLQHTGASVMELDRAFYAAALEQMASNPVKAVEMFVRKCGRFWFLSAARREQMTSVVIQVGYLALLGIGLWRCRQWGQDTVLMLALVAYVMLLHAASYADLRFSLPVMPFVCILAAVATAKR